MIERITNHYNGTSWSPTIFAMTCIAFSMHCLVQDVSKSAPSSKNRLSQGKIDLAEVTDLDAAEAHEGGFGIDEQTHDTVAEQIPWATIDLSLIHI